jgi:hypothetical protein
LLLEETPDEEFTPLQIDDWWVELIVVFDDGLYFDLAMLLATSCS